MGQPKHTRVVDDNGDVHDIIIPVLEMIEAATGFSKPAIRSISAILDGRASPSSITGPTTRCSTRGQLSFEGAVNGNLSGPGASGLTANGPHDELWLAPTEL
jgi:hypothetical protein